MPSALRLPGVMLPLLFDFALIAATLLCSLVAGFLFAFVVVGMPGIGTLGDGAFLRAFQAMDRVIQNTEPVFMLVWVGSVVMLLMAALTGWSVLDGAELGLLMLAVGLYVLGVQVPTVVVNIPLNNQLQAVDVGGLDAEGRRTARRAFEPRWNRWNRVRTNAAAATTLALVLLLWLR